MILLKMGSPEWEEAWNWVESHPLNENITIDELDKWQYMGSYRLNNIVITTFRYINHPRTNLTHTVNYKHSVSEDSIEKIYKM